MNIYSLWKNLFIAIYYTFIGTHNSAVLKISYSISELNIALMNWARQICKILIDYILRLWFGFRGYHLARIWLNHSFGEDRGGAEARSSFITQHEEKEGISGT